jgi:hypothetical protein
MGLEALQQHGYSRLQTRGPEQNEADITQPV